MTPNYVELHARSAFSFLRGASDPEVLALEAARLGLAQVALCDRDGVYGAARFYREAQANKLRPSVGAELTLDDGSVLPLLVKNRTGYQNLCRLITQAKLRGTKHESAVKWEELAEFSQGLVALTGDEEGPVRRALAMDDRASALGSVEKLIAAFGRENVYVEVQRHLRRGEAGALDRLFDLATALRLPTLATNGVLYATAAERTIQDVFTCTREHTHLDAAGRRLEQNDERHFKGAKAMRELFADHPEAVEQSVRLAERLEFTLEDLGYEFPRYQGMSDDEMDAFLHKMAFAGARSRYSHLGGKVYDQLNYELGLIKQLRFSGYFLIVWDIVNFCTENNIMVQGRGSAANSVVCFALGITVCDPIKHHLLFERFLSAGRTTWPDIDLDLPSGDRREKAIQEVYRRYGRHGAAMTANVITYRGRSAMKEIGKALNIPAEVLDRFSRLFANGDFHHTMPVSEQLRQAGVSTEHPRSLAAALLYQQIKGLPRHLSQHSGGMIICQGALNTIVPLENASMEGRVVAQWDKDDCADLGIIKVDLLGLGMMAVMQETVELCAARERDADLAAIPKDDKDTYDLMCEADTIGVFQVESRAQMATLPRMQPRTFYDVVVQVAIIRPGPIQGGMLDPFFSGRAGTTKPDYFGNEKLEEVLGRTYGVPLFQEQLLQMAMIMADFSGKEAEELRRALSFNRSQKKMDAVCVKLREAMDEKGVAPAIAERVVKSVQSFAVYGFPESHAISFAVIAYASCWMKVHRLPEFYAGLLNNQPMGFYSAASLVFDGEKHGLKTLPVDVQLSGWFCSIEKKDLKAAATNADPLRLGFCYVRGMKREDADRIVEERGIRPFASLADFQLRCRLPKSVERTLAKIGALDGLAKERRQAQWKVEVRRDPEDLFAAAESVAPPPLAPMQTHERIRADYSGTGLTTEGHPMKLVRDQVTKEWLVWTAEDLLQAKNGQRLRIGGQVICRQRPGTAKGVVFISVEDETGVSNAVVYSQLFEQYRLLITSEGFLVIEGVLQKHNGVTHLKAERFYPLVYPNLATPDSHDFH